jgi:Uma2 family endonuclease
MSAQARHASFTYEDYVLFPEDGKRHELLDGEHHVTPAPKTKHQRCSGNLSWHLNTYLRNTNAGLVFTAPTDVVLSDVDVVQPDLLVVSTGRMSIITEDNIRGAPDLAIEILSEATRRSDEVVKRKLYERYRVSEYWIVDPELETVKIYRMTDQGYLRVAELSREAADTLTTPLLLAFRLSLAEIFA